MGARTKDEGQIDQTVSSDPGSSCKRDRLNRFEMGKGKIKDLVDSQKSTTNLDLQVGDFLRIRKPNGWYCKYDEVTGVEKTSVTLKSRGRCPLVLFN